MPPEFKILVRIPATDLPDDLPPFAQELHHDIAGEAQRHSSSRESRRIDLIQATYDIARTYAHRLLHLQETGQTLPSEHSPIDRTEPEKKRVSRHIPLSEPPPPEKREYHSECGALLRERRMKLHRNSLDVAKSLGITDGHLCRMEQGKRAIPDEKLYPWIKALGVPKEEWPRYDEAWERDQRGSPQFI